MLGASFFGGLFGWLMIFVTHLAFRRRSAQVGNTCRCGWRLAGHGASFAGLAGVHGSSDFDLVGSRHEVSRCSRELPWLVFITLCYFVWRKAPFPATNCRWNLATMDELLKWRDEFPILDRTTYLISNSLGAMPRGVYDEMREYADAWAKRGVRAWEEGWWDMAVGVGDKIAPLIGAGRARFRCIRMSRSRKPSSPPASIFAGRATKW